MADTGRPTKFTAPNRAKILKALRDGVPRKYAALSADVSWPTFKRWMADPGEEFQAFKAAAHEAEAAGVAAKVRLILSHGRKDWRAVQYLLQCYDPGEFSTDKRRIAELERRLSDLEKSRGAAGNT